MPTGEEAQALLSAATGDDASVTSLLKRFQQGDEAAAGEIYRRYAGRLHTLARANLSPVTAARVDAEDLVQSVFRRFFQATASDNYVLPSAEELWKLLLVIMLNRIRSEEVFQRAAKRDVRLNVSMDALQEAIEIPDRSENANQLLKMMIQEALGRLAPHYRELIDLRLQGFEVAEIAEKTGRSKRTVERLLQEAHAELKEFLGREL